MFAIVAATIMATATAKTHRDPAMRRQFVSLLWLKPEASSPPVWGAVGADMTLGSLDLGLKAEACACPVVKTPPCPATGVSGACPIIANCGDSLLNPQWLEGMWKERRACL